MEAENGTAATPPVAALAGTSRRSFATRPAHAVFAIRCSSIIPPLALGIKEALAVVTVHGDCPGFCAERRVNGTVPLRP